MFQKCVLSGLGLSLFILSGCSKVSLEEVTRQYYDGDANRAYELAQKGANIERKGNASGDELLWQIQGGVIGFDLEDMKAKFLLERAEENINANELEGVISGFFENLGAVLVNDTVIPYKGFLYEGVMVNYYKALFYMSQQNYADARVEFNRASDRQRRIKEYYEKEIAKAQGDLARIESSEDTKGDKQKQKEEGNKILKSYSNLQQFAGLNGYINPMIDYVSGIFFMLEGDNSKAVDFLKESYGTSQAPLIGEDLQKAKSGGYKEKQTWIIIEDGKSPFKVQKIFSLPVFTGNTFLAASLALPDMKEGVEFANSYTLQTEGENLNATKISMLNPLAFNEFDKQIPFIITRGIISTTTKTLTQYFTQQAAKQAGGVASLLVGIGTAAYSIATTQADTRISTVMPNGFYALRVKNAEGSYELKANGRIIATIVMGEDCDDTVNVCVSEDSNNLVYIRNAGKNIFNRVLFSK